MRFVERQNIDTDKWNQLVESTEGHSFFSYAWYLDAVAENWCVLVNENYTSGLAVPYTNRMGVECLYTPIFIRYIELLGSQNHSEDIAQLLRNRFRYIDVCIKAPLLGNQSIQQEFQLIQSKDQVPGSQAKRMLKKAEKQSWSTVKSEDFQSVLTTVEKYLKGRIEGINDHSYKRLEQLCRAAQNELKLVVYSCADYGGIICLEEEHQTLYLKGTVDPEVKKQGGMYALMQLAITEALEKGKKFDFGGSRMEGVKRFNHNLGGRDEFYYRYKIDNAPFWFKLAKRIKNLWKK